MIWIFLILIGDHYASQTHAVDAVEMVPAPQIIVHAPISVGELADFVFDLCGGTPEDKTFEEHFHLCSRRADILCNQFHTRRSYTFVAGVEAERFKFECKRSVAGAPLLLRNRTFSFE